LNSFSSLENLEDWTRFDVLVSSGRNSSHFSGLGVQGLTANSNGPRVEEQGAGFGGQGGTESRICTSVNILAGLLVKLAPQRRHDVNAVHAPPDEVPLRPRSAAQGSTRVGAVNQRGFPPATVQAMIQAGLSAGRCCDRCKGTAFIDASRISRKIPSSASSRRGSRLGFAARSRLSFFCDSTLEATQGQIVQMTPNGICMRVDLINQNFYERLT